MKTSELTGVWLAHWVALAEGLEPQQFSHEGQQWVRCRGDLTPYAPHEQWGQGGPIIEAFDIVVERHDGRWFDGAYRAGTCIDGRAQDGKGGISLFDHQQMGPTYLVAAMRVRVCLVFGDEVPDPP